jgi:hypothetical protein
MIRTFSQAIGESLGIEELPQDTQTVPDMSLSVKEILQRFRRGTLDPASLIRNVVDEDDDLDDDFMDDVEDMVDLQIKQQQLYENVNGTIGRHLASVTTGLQNDKEDVPSES